MPVIRTVHRAPSPQRARLPEWAAGALMLVFGAVMVFTVLAPDSGPSPSQPERRAAAQAARPSDGTEAAPTGQTLVVEAPSRAAADEPAATTPLDAAPAAPAASSPATSNPQPAPEAPRAARAERDAPAENALPGPQTAQRPASPPHGAPRAEVRVNSSNPAQASAPRKARSTAVRTAKRKAANAPPSGEVSAPELEKAPRTPAGTASAARAAPPALPVPALPPPVAQPAPAAAGNPRASQRPADEAPRVSRPAEAAQPAPATAPELVRATPVQTTSAGAGADSVALLASTAERVWVRVNNQRTVVLAIGQELPGYGRLLAVQGGRARFEKATLSERAP